MNATKTMTKGDLKLEIVEHIILKNYWEYYILKDDEYSTEDIKTAVVMGDATELGDVSLAEMEPYIKSRTSNLSELMPAAGYKWEN
jgi:RNase P/RNase MRP subunit POP5